MTGVAAVSICFVFHFVYVFMLPIVEVNIWLFSNIGAGGAFFVVGSVWTLKLRLFIILLTCLWL